MYVPLQSTGAHNGGLCVAKGEHKKGLFEHNLGNNSVESKFLSLNPDYLTNESTLQLELGAGDLLLFNGYLPHCGTRNTSKDVRFALTIRYTNLEDDYFIHRGWRWQDLAASGLAALQSRNADD
jgi:ectoine hydroxylase-related dioxygenase (phytanoyl-CoA dioxygenase family)